MRVFGVGSLSRTRRIVVRRLLPRSSALQSGHATISPFTASEPTVTSASHSGHFGTRESIGLVGLGRAVAAAAMAALVEVHALIGDREEGVGGAAILREPCDAEGHAGHEVFLAGPVI